MEELLTERQAATLLNVSVKSLQGWRSRGGGPRYHKLGRCVRYAVADLEAFIQNAVRLSTSDPGPTPPSLATIRTEHLLGKTGRGLQPPSQPASDPTAPPGRAPIPRIRHRVRLRRAYITRPPETT
jgi:hypothetical protein